MGQSRQGYFTMSLDPEQDDNLHRVTERIGSAIVEFFRPPRDVFHADELRKWVSGKVGVVAPGSPDRIMRALRQQHKIDYEVVSRRASSYRIIRKAEQRRLF